MVNCAGDRNVAERRIASVSYFGYKCRTQLIKKNFSPMADFDDSVD